MMTIEAQLRTGRRRAQLYAERNGHSLGDFLPDEFDSEHARRFFSVCLQCGRRALVSVEDDEATGEHIILIEGSATFKHCEPNALEALEGKAWLLGQSPLLLETRLQRAIEELGEDEQAHFDPGDFQPHYARWLSDDGKHALQWKLRTDPLWPISVDNPQGAWGVVEFQTLVREDDVMPARYVGALLDANEEGLGEEWQIEPLQPEECGLAYRDDEGQWRFLRVDGTIGFIVSLRDLVFERPWLDVDPDDEMLGGIQLDNPTHYP